MGANSKQPGTRREWGPNPRISAMLLEDLTLLHHQKEGHLWPSLGWPMRTVFRPLGITCRPRHRCLLTSSRCLEILRLLVLYKEVFHCTSSISIGYYTYNFRNTALSLSLSNMIHLCRIFNLKKEKKLSQNICGKICGLEYDELNNFLSWQLSQQVSLFFVGQRLIAEVQRWAARQTRI